LRFAATKVIFPDFSFQRSEIKGYAEKILDRFVHKLVSELKPKPEDPRS